MREKSYNESGAQDETVVKVIVKAEKWYGEKFVDRAGLSTNLRDHREPKEWLLRRRAMRLLHLA